MGAVVSEAERASSGDDTSDSPKRYGVIVILSERLLRRQEVGASGDAIEEINISKAKKAGHRVPRPKKS